MAITDVAHDAVDYVRPAEVAEEELYHPKTWLGKYVFSQDAKIIALQYSMTCLLYTSPSPRDKRHSRMPSSA